MPETHLKAESTGIPGTSYQKHTSLTRQSYGVMSASEWRS
jgi:hypothetical protein